VFIDMPRLFQAAFQALKLVVDARTIGKVRSSSSSSSSSSGGSGGGGSSSSSILAAPRHGGSQVIFSAPHSLEQVAGEWMSPELLQVVAAMIMWWQLQPRSHFPPFSGSG
jgi:predicted dehydrogenase